MGHQFLAMDNRYNCPELGVVLRDHFNAYSAGTCRQNCKGWDKALMNLTKQEPRGTSKVAYDKQNEVLIGQWNDNKVVNFSTTLNEAATF